MKIIGTGIDILEISRLKEKIDKNSGLIDKLFTQEEIDYCRSKKNWIHSMAGRFAAKEAIYKVMSSHMDSLNWKDIEILSGSSIPVISDSCKVARVMKEKGLKCSVSIAHEDKFAVAHSIFWKEG
ncbi:holo-ACP synthase [Elusimicrobiota bacterium]